jgi:Tfp pilus assembly PilM family ATPase
VEPLKINKIALCGSGIFAGFDKLLAKELKIETVIANPFVNITKNPKKDFAAMSFEYSLALTKSLGLAIKDYQV